MLSPIRGTTEQILANRGHFQTPKTKKSYQMFNNIVQPTNNFVHVPVGKVGDYPIGKNGEEANPEKSFYSVGESSVSLRDKLKLSKLKAQNEDVSKTLLIH